MDAMALEITNDRETIQPRILIADDQPDIVEALRLLLKGHGYTTEALNAALAWGRNRFGPRRCVALIAPGNEPSARIAMKCAFMRGADIVSAGRPRMVYERML